MLAKLCIWRHCIHTHSHKLYDNTKFGYKHKLVALPFKYVDEVFSVIQVMVNLGALSSLDLFQFS